MVHNAGGNIKKGYFLKMRERNTEEIKEKDNNVFSKMMKNLQRIWRGIILK